MKTYFNICIIILLATFGSKAYAGSCSDSFLSIPTEVNWQCIFPISIGGVVEMGDGQSLGDEGIGDSICVCGSSNPTIGISVSFWEPARVIDTVRDAWCMNAIGTQLSNPSPGMSNGTQSIGGNGSREQLFAQMHYYKFPVWAILDMFTDLPCQEDTQFDIAMMSELLPNWNDPVLALLLNPEALVFGNPVAQLACAADSVAAATGSPINHLFWCMGSWGNAYPFTGTIGATDRVQANAGIAARSIYMMGRTGLLLDPGVDACGSVYTPIWKKDHYKLQLMRPVKDDACRPIGMTGIGWTQGKNKIIGGGNYSWMVFRKVKCCVGYSF
ncbi:IncF plasmid conjugative transfer pilus assembly protein TraU [uncultured Gammaproteobacteria bacterium]|uniref:TraU family protein n=1 Tax=Bathymodiolus heckerae thiotrophic gill symbiont TaxID=1052212 RepID=UPI0010B75812|nr:TraU family protein [Bathymodiolus heckerae thiotrophic gill symbiont]CAC9527362.1 IncF plasmid conjugative transfer pilus assembly protein TraU [uncultured Gammaproteobacteria bacterium]CAC9588167.1 IncF plasmid conjugative transfer pilus assembly protein TraU [uncultured Gammaproteobacteria bacterium]CAC9959128.1 IncF plasmid conjugative transfer pilus assembly protein TraU [uncultured Gammaproteobacteria bacterium]SHN89522.1 IncF plasmid conjugative transfer pilus assemblyprotein TraU [Ba